MNPKSVGGSSGARGGGGGNSSSHSGTPSRVHEENEESENEDMEVRYVNVDIGNSGPFLNHSGDTRNYVLLFLTTFESTFLNDLLVGKPVIEFKNIGMNRRKYKITFYISYKGVWRLKLFVVS